MTLLAFRASYLNSNAPNPNRSISSIDVSGGIVCSRTSGPAPFIIQVSASAILAVGTDFPFKDLWFTWDFGDPGSTETFTNPGIGGGIKNTNSDQILPKAAHCYRTPGTYTLTLYGYGNRAGSLLFVTATQQITVSARDVSGGRIFVDTVAGSDSNDGLSEEAPKQTLSAINTFTASGQKKRLSIKKGSAFAGGVSLLLGVSSSLLVDTYGTGAMPEFDVNSGTSSVNALRMTNGGSSSPSPKDDVVVSGIRFSTSGTSETNAVVGIGDGSNATATVTNIYLDNCEVHIGTDNVDVNGLNIGSGNKHMSNFGLWNCVITGDMNPSRVNRSHGMFWNILEWGLVVGGSWEGGTSVAVNVLDHHIYPSIKNQSLFLWVDFKEGPNRNYCINLNHDAADSEVFEYANYHVIGYCHFSGTQRAHDASNATNDPTKSMFKNLLCAGCTFDGFTAVGTVLFYCAEDYTLRDFEVWGATNSNFFFPAVIPSLKVQIYRGKIHMASGVTGTKIIEMDSTGFLEPPEITQLTIVDERTTASLVSIPWAVPGALLEGNRYYCPNDTDAKFLFDVATGKSVAEWQAQGYDLDLVTTDPGWTDPANGDFS